MTGKLGTAKVLTPFNFCTKIKSIKFICSKHINAASGKSSWWAGPTRLKRALTVTLRAENDEGMRFSEWVIRKTIESKATMMHKIFTPVTSRDQRSKRPTYQLEKPNLVCKIDWLSKLFCRYCNVSVVIVVGDVLIGRSDTQLASQNADTVYVSAITYYNII